MIVTDNEKEFVASLKALLKRYEVKIEITPGTGWDQEDEWLFSNDAKTMEKVIHLTMEDIHRELVKQHFGE